MEQEMKCIEKSVSLFDSKIWGWQTDYYNQVGIEAWSKSVVPSYITSNTFVAQAYANLILSFAEDCLEQGIEEPITIVELGAGHGQLSYRLLSGLDQAQHKLSGQMPSINYVMTDIAEKNLAFNQRHPQLQRWVTEGTLSFGLFDANRQDGIELINGNKRTRLDSVKGPLVIIANYLFDSLKNDSFSLQDGELFENKMTVLASAEVDESDTVALIKSMETSWETEPVLHKRYADPACQRVLERYQNEFDNGEIIFPTGAINCLSYLHSLTQHPTLVLSSDKGFWSPLELLIANKPSFANHGSFSVMVNYHALGVFVENSGGIVFETPPQNSSLNTAVFVLRPAAEKFPKTGNCATSTMNFSPISYFSVYKNLVRNQGQDATVDYLLSVLRLSSYDPHLVAYFKDRIMELYHSDQFSLNQAEEMKWCLKRSWNNYFIISPNSDTCKAFASLFMLFDQYDDVLAALRLEDQMIGLDLEGVFVLAMANYLKHNHTQALRWLETILEKSPDFEPAIGWHARIRSEQAQLGLAG